MRQTEALRAGVVPGRFVRLRGDPSDYRIYNDPIGRTRLSRIRGGGPGSFIAASEGRSPGDPLKLLI